MKDARKFLAGSTVVFRVLAWVSLVLQVIVGLIVLVSGGEPVAVAGVDVPARVIGVLNCVAGVIYFFLMYFVAHLVHLLLEIRQQLEK